MNGNIQFFCRIPATTFSSASCPVICRYSRGSSVSRLTLIQSTPALFNAPACFSSSTPFVVSVTCSTPFRDFISLISCTQSFRTSGSPPVILNRVILDGKEGKATETKLEKGRKLIRELLDDKKEISIRELDEKAKEQRISGRTMRDVRSRMKNELEYRVNEKQENSIRLKE